MEATLTKITVGTILLQDLVSRAVKGSTMVSVIPLSCLMQVKVKDNVLSVRTTDNTNYLTTKAELNQPDFEMVVDSKLFSSLISKLSSATVSISVEGNNVLIEGNGKYNMALADDESGSKIVFPELDVEPIGTSFHLTPEEVRSILSLSKSCKAENKEIPPLFNYYADNERILTSDGFKACSNPIKMTDTPISVSPSVMELVPSVIDDSGVTIYQDSEHIVFESTKGKLVGKKQGSADVEGFPAEDLVEAFNTTLESSTEINRTQLLQAIERICLFTEAFDQGKLTLHFLKDKVVLHATSTNSEEGINYLTPFTEEVSVTLEVEALKFKNELSACDMEKIIIGFNANYGTRISCGQVNLVLGVVGEYELGEV